MCDQAKKKKKQYADQVSVNSANLYQITIQK